MMIRNNNSLRRFMWVILLAISAINAQLSSNYSATFRNGNLTQDHGNQRQTLHNDLKLVYRASLRGVRLMTDIQLEGFDGTNTEHDYIHLLRKNITATWDWGEFEAGNFYQIFGQGLVLRGFDLPGFIYESAVNEVQQRVVRDISGAALRLRHGPATIEIVSGTPIIDPLLPPARRKGEGNLNGIHAETRLPLDLSFGVEYVNHESDVQTKVIGGSLGWTPGTMLTAFSEPLSFDMQIGYAEQIDAPSWRIVEGLEPHALLVSGTLGWGPFGASLEYKDYLSFEFGFNDPPPLVRESSERLLNRATHVLLASNEKGYQIESYLSLATNGVLTLNLSRAENDLGFGFKPLFEEYYAALDWIGAKWSGRLFLDNGLEEIVLQRDRWTTGISAERSVSGRISIGFDVQAQIFNRFLASPISGDSPLLDQSVMNQYFALKMQLPRGITIGAGVEQSNDPELTKKIIQYPSLTVGWQPTYQFGLALFVGDRRRGTACDHGYCVEVLDFSGTELSLRWSL